MNPNNNPNQTFDSSIQDAQDPEYDGSTSSDNSFSSSTSSTIIYDMQIEEQMSLLSTEETICISTDDDDDDSRNEEQHEEQTQQMASTLSQDWLPPVASTPVSTIATTNSSRHSERELENELFQNIENLVREFLRRPNREYPYYRVIRWTIDERPRLEYLLTVVINRPTIILE